MPNVNLISLDCAQEDPMVLRKRVESLRKNLEVAGVRVTAHRGHEPAQNNEFEHKSDAVTLYTLALTFLTSGAAVAVVNALRATFEAAHSANLKATLTVGNRSMEISGEHLAGSEAQKLEDTLNNWLRIEDKGALAS